MKQYFKQGATVLTLLSASIGLTHADADVGQLQQQVSQLEQSLKQLKTQLAQIQNQNEAVTEATTADEIELATEAETEDDQSFVTRAELQGLQSDLENYKYQVQRDRDTKTALSTRQLLINGVVQAKASYIDEAQRTPPTGTNTGMAVQDRHSSFDLGAVQIGFIGNLYKDYEEGKNLDFNLRFGTSPQTGTNNSYLNLLDAQLTYHVLPTLSADTGRLSVTLGQQLLPFGQEVQATEDLKPTINNALFSLPGLGYGLALREVGLIVRGDALPTVDYGYNYRSPMISYAFGLVNGNGANKSDDNDDKNFIGRLRYTLPAEYNSWLRELSFGLSWYQGKSNLFEIDGTSAAFAGKGDVLRKGFDIYYNHHPFGVTYEYVQGEDDTYISQTAQTYKRESESHTGTLFWNFGEQFVKGFRNQGRYDDWWPKSYQAFYRYDTIDRDKNLADQTVDIHSLGLNAFFAETTKFQINLNHVNNDITNKSYNELVAQFQYGF
ncbi:hypothetical protein O4M77_13825 [Acinetobacter sp. YWS30-1]|uniref:hypothetical protein n=1 Tax=Acinetobacter sp. YWS30-1 TaxID=2996862 RepID=UPI002B25C177|nr:hypothetical protein [Acinetobacter sp. YWS30-1]WPC34742.1 hypothetical protein O4M77_13825 [Acinetobacter sp. YWS30-1]